MAQLFIKCAPELAKSLVGYDRHAVPRPYLYLSDENLLGGHDRPTAVIACLRAATGLAFRGYVGAIRGTTFLRKCDQTLTG
jgi:hypothetical protein